MKIGKIYYPSAFSVFRYIIAFFSIYGSNYSCSLKDGEMFSLKQGLSYVGSRSPFFFFFFFTIIIRQPLTILCCCFFWGSFSLLCHAGIIPRN